MRSILFGLAGISSLLAGMVSFFVGLIVLDMAFTPLVIRVFRWWIFSEWHTKYLSWRMRWFARVSSH